VPGTASAANHYHYAANNPIGRSDPLGLRPLADKELQAVRDRMDRNLLEQGRDFTVDHAGDISAITGIAAYGLMFTPAAFLSPALAGVSLATGTLSSYQNFRDGKIVGGVVDAVGAAAGGAALYKGLRAGHEAVAMGRATHAAVDSIEAGRRADAVGLSRLADTKYSLYDRQVAQARASSIARHTAEEHAHGMEAAGISINVAGLAESHAKDGGIRIPRCCRQELPRLACRERCRPDTHRPCCGRTTG
jgi:hypothetical protein